NQEEFFAILIANIYLAETGKRYLGANHHDFSPLNKDLSTSEKFLGKGIDPLPFDLIENRRLVNKLYCENWSLCTPIADKVDANFTPTRECVRNPGLSPHSPADVYAAEK